ncbi:MAG: hypothetical protein SPF59_03690 [Oscillospiraceae bacterium]|nr:hypothetical protein [Oscillospiraceae bacterium]
MKLDYSRGTIGHTKYIHLYDPRKTTDMKTLQKYDDWARRDIVELEAEIETIQAYRLDLMERAQYLTAEPGTLSIELHRRRTYRGSVEYYLQYNRTYPDGTSNTEQSTMYAGKDRRKAIADYRAACKAHPGAPCVLDIGKSPWER